MPKLGNKVLVDLSAVEKELLAIIVSAEKQGSPKATLAKMVEAKKLTSNALLKLPGGDSSLSAVRKSLVVVLNTVGGLVDGLGEGMTRSEFRAAFSKLKTRFIPKFREAVDAFAKKVKSSASQLSPTGLFQDGAVIVAELNKVLADLLRLKTMVANSTKREEPSSHLSVAIRNRIDYVYSVYGMLPSGDGLDDIAELLAVLSGTLTTMEHRSSENKKFPKAFSNFSGYVVDFRHLLNAVEKRVKTETLVFDDDKRKKIESLLKRKAGSISDVDEAAPDLSRSPDEYLKTKIAEVKSGKAKLPKSIDGPYALVRSPVVAIFGQTDSGKGRPLGGGTVSSNFSKTALLDQFGIKYIMLEDYLILMNQLLLAVNRETVDKAVAQMPRGKRPKSQQAAHLQYAKEVVDLLNSRGSQEYALVSSHVNANPRNAKMLLFYVMPARILNALIHRGWNKLTSWNLPFD